VDVGATYPMTMGQLSVWRDVEKMPPERRWEANLVFAWDIPEGHSIDEVWNALGVIGMRHESLRTIYVVDDVENPRQRLATDDPAAVLDAVRQGTVDVADRAAVEDEQVRRAFDVTCDIPWRAWILTRDGLPRDLLVVINHMAADAAGLLIMRDDFHTILAGSPLPAPGLMPRELAVRQRDSTTGRLRTSEAYWRRTLAAAPRQTASPGPGEPIGATLHTGIPLSKAHEGAAGLGISLASVLLAAYYCALREATGSSKILLYPMANNRFDPTMADIVTSQNQWVPLVAEFDEAEPFDTLAGKIHWKTFNALKNGCHDVDATNRIRAEFSAMDPPVDPGYNFNAVVAPAGDPATESIDPSRVEWYVPARTTGPGFYLIARAISSIELVFRVNRPGIDKEALTTCLTSVQDRLLSVAGLPRT